MRADRPSLETDPFLREINVTPLVDVFLVLLLIFMIAAPMLSAGLDVELPEVLTSVPKDSRAVILTVGPAGTLAIGDRVVTLEEAVEASRRAAGQGVYLRADANVPWGVPISVLDAIRAAGVRDVSILTTPLPEEEPR